MNPVFIKIGETRIKLNNIKNYGISDYAERNPKLMTREEYERSNQDSIGKKILFHTVHIISRVYFNDPSDNTKPYYESYEEYITESRKGASKYPSKYEWEEAKGKYLYVTTYQNDNYTFRQPEVDFDIHEKMKRLDEYLT